MATVQLAVSPLRAQAEGVTELIRGLSPSLARQVLPLLDQLMPMYLVESLSLNCARWSAALTTCSTRLLT